MNYEKQVDHLIDNAKELVSKLHATQNPDIQRLRDRVDAFVASAQRRTSQRRGIGSNRGQGAVRIGRIPGSILDYVHDHPFLAVVTAASLAWTLGHLSSAVRERTLRP